MRHPLPPPTHAACVQAYEATKKQLDRDISRLLGSLAGRKTAEERRSEASLLENFVGDLPIDAEKEMRDQIELIQARIKEEQARSKLNGRRESSGCL